MRPVLILLPALALLAGCDATAPSGVDVHKLDAAVGEAVGDPSTCLLLVEKGSARVVYRFGTHSNCGRTLPSCEGAGTTTANDFAKAAAAGTEKTISCDSGPNGENRVAWASGPVVKSPGAKYDDLAYAVVMESPTALPGREIAIRVNRAFAKAGM